ncbi:MAG: diaminopimelate epimerase, partial [Nitratireductor sp.]
ALASEGNIPYDQLMEIRDPKNPENDAGVRILNCDGSEAQACGNGMRCVVAYLNAQDQKLDYKIATRAGLLTTTYQDADNITVDMGKPNLGWEQIPTTEEFSDTSKVELQIGPIDAPVLHSPSLANMGNPHAIFWVEAPVESYDLHLFGPLLENHPIFPEKANITIAQVINGEHINIRTWERAAGLTLACGSAACATLVSAIRTGRLNEGVRKATITVPSGKNLIIEWLENNHVLMSGPAEFEFFGQFDRDTGEWKKD